MKWLSAYIYSTPPWEQLLIQEISPFCKQFMLDGESRLFFFIRYWEKGPHIRLRFKCDSDKLCEELPQSLTNCFDKYFIGSPSAVISTRSSVEPSISISRQTNIIEFTTYEPENERYGGPVGMSLSEEHFCLSSVTTLDIISTFESWEYERAIGIALQLQLGLIYSFGFNLQEAIYFFREYFNGFISHFPADQNIDSKARNSSSSQDEYSLYETLISSNKQSYLNIIENLWSSLNSGLFFREQWMNHWINNNKILYKKYRKCYLNKELLVSSDLSFHRDISGIVSSLIHMTNNRLGVANQDECLVVFILQYCLSQI